MKVELSVIRPFPRAQRAFTLVEMVTGVGVFSLVVLAAVYTQIFGLKQDELTESKLGSSDASRAAFERLCTEIRSCKIWTVGNRSSTNYTSVSTNALQSGTTIQLSLTTDTNSYIQYYFDTNAGALYRQHSGQAASLVATNLTGTLFIRAEDYLGNVLSTASYKSVIHLMLQFAQYQYPQVIVGSGYLYNYYKIDFLIASHVPDGP